VSSRRRSARTLPAPETTSGDRIRYRLELAGVALICLKVALIPVVFDLSADVAFTVPKALFSHATAYVLAGVLLGLWLQSPVPTRASWSPLHIAVGAFFLVSIAATLLAESRYLALFGAHERMLGLSTIADNVLLFVAVAYLVRTRARATSLAVSFFSGAVVVLIYGAIQISGRDPLRWSVDSAARPFSTIGQSNSLAEYLVVVAAVAIAIAIFEDVLAIWKRAALSLFGVVALGGAVGTQTRSVVLGMLATALAIVLLTWFRHTSWLSRLGILAAAGLAAAAFTFLLYSTPLGTRLSTTVTSEPLNATSSDPDAAPRLEAAADVRFALYRMSLSAVERRPFLGFGPDNFLAGLPELRSANEPYEVQANANSSAHSWVAQTAVSSGIPGLVTFIAIPLLALWLTLRKRLGAVPCVGIVALAAFLGEGLTTINEISTEWIFWAATGLVAASLGPAPATSPFSAATGSRRKRSAREMQTPSGWRTGAGIATAVLGLVVAAATLSALDASRAAKASLVARLNSDGQRALEQGLRATRLDGGRSQYWGTLGLAYIALDRAREAAIAFDRASQLAPYDIRYDGDLARALAVLGQRGDDAARRRAGEVADRAVRVDPNNPGANLTKAVVLQFGNDFAGASEYIERAVALDRVSPSGQTSDRQIYVIGVQVLSAARRPEDAISLAGLGLSRLPVRATQVPVRVELARALAADGKFTRALAEIDAALAIDPADRGAQQLRAQIAAQIQ
jgi:tetratricopeptide (TPR) repeat protein